MLGIALYRMYLFKINSFAATTVMLGPNAQSYVLTILYLWFQKGMYGAHTVYAALKLQQMFFSLLLLGIKGC